MSLTGFNRSRRAAYEASRLAAEQEQTAADDEQRLTELRERAAAIGVPNAKQKGEKRLLDDIAEIEAAQRLQELKLQAAELGIELTDEASADDILALIEVHQAAVAGDNGDGNVPE